MSVTPQDPLDAGQIRAAMAPALLANLSGITVFQETDSTNNAVMRLPPEHQHAHAVLAEGQTSGRGRRQRTWHSPCGGNIYLSLGWRFRQSGTRMSTLPLMTAVAVCHALDRAGLQGHGIKWPNDILFRGKKLAGILVELKSAGGAPALAVIGIGLNVQMPSDAGTGASSISRPWTDLATALGPEKSVCSRNRLTAILLETLLEALEEFEQQGFDRFKEAWRGLDVLDGRRVVLEQEGERIAGVARGVDVNGGLLLEIEGFETRAFHSGDVSVHYE